MTTNFSVSGTCHCSSFSTFLHYRSFSKSEVQLQSNRSRSLLGVGSSDRYRCKADGLYFRFSNFVLPTDFLFCMKKQENGKIHNDPLFRHAESELWRPKYKLWWVSDGFPSPTGPSGLLGTHRTRSATSDKLSGSRNSPFSK